VQQLEQANATLSSDNVRLQQQLEQATSKVADSESLLSQANSQLSSTMAQLDSIKSAQKASEASHASQVLDLQLGLEQLKAEQQKVQPSINALQESNKTLKKVCAPCFDRRHVQRWPRASTALRRGQNLSPVTVQGHMPGTDHSVLPSAGADHRPQQGGGVRAAAGRG
jgi:hypothetical protein